jgi:uncharacterized protein (UPF0262 family)
VNFAYGTNKSSFTNIATVTEGSNLTVGTLAILDTMGRLENGNQPNMSVELGQEAQKRFELVGKELKFKTNPVCTSVEKDSYPVDVLVKDSSRSGTLTTTLTVSNGDDIQIDAFQVALSPFRRTIREYFAICDSYYQAIRQASPGQIETIDMARRGIHNDAAGLLKERLETRAIVDFDTARRLFTLICVLHIKGH